MIALAVLVLAGITAFVGYHIAILLEKIRHELENINAHVGILDDDLDDVPEILTGIQNELEALREEIARLPV